MSELTLTKLKWYRGDDYKVRAAIKDANGSAVDISSTDIVLKMTCKAALADPIGSAKFAKTTATAAQATKVSGGTSGLVDFLIADTDTDALTSGTYYFDIEMTDTDASEHTVAYGTITVTKDVSSAT